MKTNSLLLKVVLDNGVHCSVKTNSWLLKVVLDKGVHCSGEDKQLVVTGSVG